MDPIRVVLSDDHPIVRAGIRTLLSTAEDVVVVGEAEDGWRTLRLLEHLECDVLLLDLSLPDLGGMEVLHRLRARGDKPHVLILSMYAEEHYAAALLSSGAAGYLSKDRSEDVVLQAIREVARTGRYVPAEGAARAAAAAPAAASPDVLGTLTPRERELFHRLAEGYSVGEIAAELGVGSSTVSTHLARVRSKLGVRNASELVAFAHRHKILR